MFGLNEKEIRVFRSLDTPGRIQDYLDTLPFNHSKGGDTLYSPRRVMREKKAHCIEGALLAAATLWYHGERPLLLDLRTPAHDFDHVVALFKKNGFWGAISKTNHAVLRYRDPIYRTVRELALSYFHEYFLYTTGEKTLREYSHPFSLKQFGTAWVTSEDDLWEIGTALDDAPHFSVVPDINRKYIRLASKLERKTGRLTEWPKSHPRT